MQNIHLSTHWNVEKIINDFDNTGFSIIDDAYPLAYLADLRSECLKNLENFRQAAVQNGVISTIRSDHILWIDRQLPLASQHITALENLSREINQYLYLGIKNIEAHFACYHAGEFYALHRDNPQGKNHRILSTVFYLHQEWTASAAGELRLQDQHQNWHIIPPLPNRIVIFQSELLHEVLLSKQQRLSITAWLRNDDTIL